VPVEEAANLIRNGLVQIVTGDENGVDGRHAAHAAVSGPLEQRWKSREYTRRITVTRWELTNGEPSIPLRSSEPCQGVYQQQHCFPLLTEPLRNGCGGVRRFQAYHRRLVRGGDHHDASFSPIFAEGVFEKRANLSPPLADQTDHDNIDVGASRDLPEQETLSDTRTSEHSDALPAADGQQSVDGSDADG